MFILFCLSNFRKKQPNISDYVLRKICTPQQTAVQTDGVLMLVTDMRQDKDPSHQTDEEGVRGDIPGSEECHKSHQQQNCSHH